MTHHYKALTYEPKIEGVRNGTIRQTIRPKPKKEVKVGDTITFHGWVGQPYRSPWSWRCHVVVTEVVGILVSEAGVVCECCGEKQPWDDPYVDMMAGDDGIDPPTGLALRDALRGRNGKGWEGEYIVIRW